MKFRAYLPTRYMTILELEADSLTQAVKDVRDGKGDFVRSDFVEFLFDELSEECIDEVVSDAEQN